MDKEQEINFAYQIIKLLEDLPKRICDELERRNKIEDENNEKAFTVEYNEMKKRLEVQFLEILKAQNNGWIRN